MRFTCLCDYTKLSGRSEDCPFPVAQTPALKSIIILNTVYVVSSQVHSLHHCELDSPFLLYIRNVARAILLVITTSPPRSLAGPPTHSIWLNGIRQFVLAVAAQQSAFADRPPNHHG